jgi:hypothetical protein
MMTRISAILLLSLGLFAASASAQPFVACLEDVDFTLTTTCGGSTPLPDSTIVQVFWDWNNNGPDAADSLLRLCDNPPNCETGPASTYNYNRFYINGAAQQVGPGYFLVDPCLVSVGLTPSPARYYLVINYPKDHPQIRWTSEVKTFQVGPQEPNYTKWDCAPVH